MPGETSNYLVEHGSRFSCKYRRINHTRLLFVFIDLGSVLWGELARIVGEAGEIVRNERIGVSCGPATFKAADGSREAREKRVNEAGASSVVRVLR